MILPQSLKQEKGDRRIIVRHWIIETLQRRRVLHRAPLVPLHRLVPRRAACPRRQGLQAPKRVVPLAPCLLLCGRGNRLSPWRVVLLVPRPGPGLCLRGAVWCVASARAIATLRRSCRSHCLRRGCRFLIKKKKHPQKHWALWTS